jgi:hypothetical protein
MILWDKINAMIKDGFKITSYKNSDNNQKISVKRNNIEYIIDVNTNDTSESLLKKLYSTEERFKQFKNE